MPTHIEKHFELRALENSALFDKCSAHVEYLIAIDALPRETQTPAESELFELVLPVLEYEMKDIEPTDHWHLWKQSPTELGNTYVPMTKSVFMEQSCVWAETTVMVQPMFEAIRAFIDTDQFWIKQFEIH